MLHFNEGTCIYRPARLYFKKIDIHSHNEDQVCDMVLDVKNFLKAML